MSGILSPYPQAQVRPCEITLQLLAVPVPTVWCPSRQLSVPGVQFISVFDSLCHAARSITLQKREPNLVIPGLKHSQLPIIKPSFVFFLLNWFIAPLFISQFPLLLFIIVRAAAILKVLILSYPRRHACSLLQPFSMIGNMVSLSLSLFFFGCTVCRISLDQGLNPG